MILSALAGLSRKPFPLGNGSSLHIYQDLTEVNIKMCKLIECIAKKSIFFEKSEKEKWTKVMKDYQLISFYNLANIKEKQENSFILEVIFFLKTSLNSIELEFNDFLLSKFIEKIKCYDW